jgi:hypothetical protein
MASSITITVDGSSKVLPLHKWRIYRKSVRSRLVFRKGGSSSSYRATRLFFECEWDHLPATEYALLVAVVDGIRNGSTVKVTTSTGLSYFDNTCISGGKFIDIEDDDLVESSGDFFEFMPAKVTFVITTAMGLTHST